MGRDGRGVTAVLRRVKEESLLSEDTESLRGKISDDISSTGARGGGKVLLA